MVIAILGLLSWFIWSAPMSPPVVLDDDEPIGVDLETLMDIEYEEGQPLPSKVTKYDGKRVKITGFMDPFTSEDTEKFLLVSDGCGCTGTPKVYHFVEIDLGDRTTGYTPDQLTIIGKMSVGEKKEDGYVISVYRITAVTVEK